ncbi:transcriptional regulator [Photobacterium jeanii]|uniref:Transcriptional regulator n=1 Tax=Photobacterium jeanii TaxID=858640 RepID=A0A178KHN1_9GAMM|nr:FliA/WhiG family RNA polymerase sigma factor [Photobacterium jeanii]OAN16730.1 transcriptional regulator [Photobacterium jeanii]PST87460.1 FliA/WhiG family RNA polymerase sigma factor [Photobacterium jeanii]
MHSAAMVDPQGVNAYQQHQQFGQQAREQRLLSKYAVLVRRVVRHMTPQVNAVISSEDMEQIGLMALLDVIRRYQDESDEALERLAAQRIRGAILDELRRMDWRSRRYRQRSYELRDAERQMSRRLGREPTNAELAAELDLDLNEVHRRRVDVQAESLGSFEGLQEEGEQFFGLSFQCQAHEKALLQQAMRQALSRLTEREQLMLTFYYEHEMNLKEIALVFELTEARVSQIHKKALKTLQSMLVDWRESV